MARSRDGLVRHLSARAAGAFVISSMIGAGVFTLPVVVRDAAGGAPGALAAWVVGGLLACCGALGYAELATRMPEAGGEYRYLERTLGPLWGFLSGWISFVVGFGAAVAASALGLSAYVAPLLGIEATAADGTLPLVAAGVILIAALVHAFGLSLSGPLQTGLAGAVFVGILALAGAGLLSEAAEPSRLLATGEGSSWWVALLQVGFAYTGWNAAGYLAGEVRDPERSLPRALVGGTLLVLVAYLALNTMFLTVVPADGWSEGIAIGEQVGARLAGPTGARLTSLLIAIAMAGSISAMTVAGPRVYLAMARDGLAPRSWGRVAGSGGGPRVALAAQTTWAIGLALTGGFEPLLVYAGSALLVFSGLAVACTILQRRRHGAPDGYRMPLYPWPPVLFVGFAAWTWSMTLLARPGPTLAGVATLLVGGMAYRLFESAPASGSAPGEAPG